MGYPIFACRHVLNPPVGTNLTDAYVSEHISSVPNMNNTGEPTHPAAPFPQLPTAIHRHLTSDCPHRPLPQRLPLFTAPIIFLHHLPCFPLPQPSARPTLHRPAPLPSRIPYRTLPTVLHLLPAIISYRFLTLLSAAPSLYSPHRFPRFAIVPPPPTASHHIPPPPTASRPIAAL